MYIAVYLVITLATMIISGTAGALLFGEHIFRMKLNRQENKKSISSGVCHCGHHKCFHYNGTAFCHKSMCNCHRYYAREDARGESWH